MLYIIAILSILVLSSFYIFLIKYFMGKEPSVNQESTTNSTPTSETVNTIPNITPLPNPVPTDTYTPTSTSSPNASTPESVPTSTPVSTPVNTSPSIPLSTGSSELDSILAKPALNVVTKPVSLARITLSVTGSCTDPLYPPITTTDPAILPIFTKLNSGYVLSSFSSGRDSLIMFSSLDLTKATIDITAKSIKECKKIKLGSYGTIIITAGYETKDITFIYYQNDVNLIYDGNRWIL